ncbi:MAG: SRPBCC domain-containing protein [Actinomycetota bacterium]|nr:SRPBCC domain-containing protein [Actinomycetota bacterium]
MTVTNVLKDPANCSMTISAEFDAPLERVWQLWADPRQLERWWGPPTYPATFTQHELTVGALVSYFMTGPEGDQPKGLWRVLEVEAPTLLVVEDLFADESGAPMEGMPATIMRVELSARESGGTAVAIRSTFPSIEAMDQLVAMGMDEGMLEAMGQMDAILLG